MDTQDDDKLFYEYKLTVNICDYNMKTIRTIIFGSMESMKENVLAKNVSTKNVLHSFSKELDELLAEYMESDKLQDKKIISGAKVMGYHTIQMLSEFIAKISDIPPYRQYMSFNFDDPLTHNIKNIPTGQTLAQDFHDNGEELSGVKINLNYFEEKDSLIVIGRDMSVVVSDIFYMKENNILNIIDLNEVIKPSGMEQHIKLYIFYGLIRRFWPMTYDIFDSYMSGNESANMSLLSYTNLPDTPKQKIDEFISPVKSDIEKGSFSNALFIEHTVYSETRIRIKKLFELWHASDIFPIIRYTFNVFGKTFIVSRVDKNTKYREYYNKMKKYLTIKHKEMIGVFTQDGRVYTFMLTPNYYSLKSFASDVDEEIIIQDMNKFVIIINTFGYLIFPDSIRLRFASTSNIVITDMSVRLVLPKSVRDNFTEVIDIMKQSSIFDITDSGNGKIVGKFSYRYNPDPSSYLQKYSGSYYDYLTSVTAKSTLDIYFPLEYNILMTLDSSVSINISGINDVVLNVFRRIMCGVLDRITGKKVPAILNYKDIKLHDPYLYDIKKLGAETGISKICQKKFFPKAVTEEAYKNMDESMKKKFVKYKNFTTGSPLYYGCLDPLRSTLYFITDKHPEGLCLPCCGKKASSIKKGIAYKKCITDYKFRSEDEENNELQRFILGYTRDKIEIGRLYQLPNKLSDAINEAIINKYMSDKRIIIGDKTSYSIETILKIVDKGGYRTVPYRRYENNLDKEVPNKPGYKWTDIISDPQVSPTLYKEIETADPQDVVYVYGNDIVIGIYTYLKQYMNKGKIKVRKINNKHLSKAKKHSTNSNYYLFSNKQSYNYLKLGSVYAIAKAIGMETEDLLESIIKLLQSPDDELVTNITTTYSMFDSYDVIVKSFMFDINGELSDTNWNDLVIVASMKLLDVTILSICYENDTFLINTLGVNSLKESLVVIFNDVNIGYYYPVILTTSRNYIGGISKSKYNSEDILYIFISRLVNEAYKGRNENAFYDIFSDCINKVFVSKGNIVYAVSMTFNSREFVLPITFHEYNMKFKADNSLFLTSSVQNSLADFVYFIQFYNDRLLDDAKKKGKRAQIPYIDDKVIHKDILMAEYMYIPRVPYIRVESYVDYQSEIIGFMSDELIYYMKPCDILDIRDIIFDSNKIYPFSLVDFKSKSLIYSPDFVNRICSRHKQTNLDIMSYRKSLYKSNIILLASIEIYQHIIENKIPIDGLTISGIEKICTNLFDISEPDFSQPYIISKCGFSRNIFCNGSKLVVQEGYLKKISQEFYNDIKNPFKRPFMDKNLMIYSLFRTGDILVSENEIIFYT
jgi:hypothetical protein